MSDLSEDTGMATDETIGQSVVRLRTGRGWTQQELADLMRDRKWPWTQSAVAKIELGKRPVRLAEAKDLALLFHIKTQDLLASPIENSILSLRERESSALSAAAKAETERAMTREAYLALDDIRRAAAGERVWFGDVPGAVAADAFRPLPWEETCTIFRYLGASEAEIDKLTRYWKRDPRKDKSRRPTQFLDYLWALLHKLVPNLYATEE